MPDNKATFTLDLSAPGAAQQLMAFAAAAEKAAAAGSKVETQAQKTRGSLASMGGAGAVGLGIVAAQAAAVATNVARSGVQIAATRQMAKDTLEEVYKSADLADKAMVRILATARKPGLTFDTVLQGVLKTSKYLGLDDALALMEQFGNAAALGGKGPRELDMAMTGLVQTLASGKVEFENVKQITEPLNIDLGRLAKNAGVTGTEFGRSGIGVETFFKALIKTLSVDTRAPDKLANSLLVLQDAIDGVKASFGDGLLGANPTKDIKQATRDVGELKESMRSLGEMARWALDAFIAKPWSVGKDLWNGLKSPFGSKQQLADLADIRADSVKRIIAAGYKPSDAERMAREQMDKRGYVTGRMPITGALIYNERQLASDAAYARFRLGKGPNPDAPAGPSPFKPSTFTPPPDDKDKGERERRAKAKREHDDAVRQQEDEVKRLEADKKRKQAQAKLLPQSYANGQKVGGYTIIGVLSKAPIHMGTHNEPGTFDITGSQLRETQRRTGKSIAQQQQDLAALGLTVAWRKQGDPGITNEHLHVADPRLSPKESARIAGQKRVVVGSQGGVGWTAANEATLVAARQRLAQIRGGSATAEFQAQQAEDELKTRQADVDEYIAKLEASITAAEAGRLELLGRLAKASGFDATLTAAKSELERAKLVKATLDNTGSEWKAVAEAAQAAADEQRSATEATRDLAQATADHLREVGQIEAAQAQEREAAGMTRKLAAATPDDADDKRAALDERRMQWRHGKEIADKQLETVQASVDEYGLRADMARTMPEETRWLSKQIAALRTKLLVQQANGAALKDQLQTRREIADLEDRRSGRLTSGQELLRASTGGSGALDEYLRRTKTGGPVNLLQPPTISLDLTRAKPAGVRGDVVDPASVLTDGIRGGFDLAGPKVIDGVRAEIAAGLTRLASQMGGAA